MKVLVAAEDSEFSKAALDMACMVLGASAETEMRIISAREPTVVAPAPFAMSAEFIREMDENSRKVAEDVVGRAEEEIRKRLPEIGSKLTTTVKAGAPAQVIVDEAERWKADLIVVGSHGKGFWQRALLGSVSNAVVHHAPCSVLVVRSKEAMNATNN